MEKSLKLFILVYISAVFSFNYASEPPRLNNFIKINESAKINNENKFKDKKSFFSHIKDIFIGKKETKIKPIPHLLAAPSTTKHYDESKSSQLNIDNSNNPDTVLSPIQNNFFPNYKKPTIRKSISKNHFNYRKNNNPQTHLQEVDNLDDTIRNPRSRYDDEKKFISLHKNNIGNNVNSNVHPHHDLSINDVMEAIRPNNDEIYGERNAMMEPAAKIGSFKEPQSYDDNDIHSVLEPRDQ
jgi:hypothetical protein